MRGDFCLVVFVFVLVEFIDGYFFVKKWVSLVEFFDSIKVVFELLKQDFVFILEFDNFVFLICFFVFDLEQLDIVWIWFEFSILEKCFDLKGGIFSLFYVGIIIDSLVLDG